MSAGNTIYTDVLVVGLGPVGTALAALLGQRGVRVLAVEQQADIYPLPRAAHFDHEVMRVFQEIGVADDIAAWIRPVTPYEFRSASGQVLLRYAPDQETSISGWASGYLMYQPGIDRALRQALADLPAVEVRSGWRLTALAQEQSSVTAEIMTPQGPLAVTARYAVGCDGASSAVRAAIGIALEDYGFDEPWLVIDGLLHGGIDLPPVSLQICDPARPTTSVPMPGRRHRWEFMLHPGEDASRVLQDDFIRDLLRPWGVAGAFDIERRAVYRFHALLARNWREARVLIAGDAAHQMPPFAGQGMCSGVRDAANLAWKLAAVLHGQAADAVLDSYMTERMPHVRAYVDLAIGMGQVVCTTDPAEAAARDSDMMAASAAGGSALPALDPPELGPGILLAGSAAAGTLFPQPWVRTAQGVQRLDDVLGAGAWLIGGTAGIPGLRQVPLDDPALAPFLPALRAWLAAQRAESVLVRPDRYVFGCGRPDVLTAAYAAAMGRREGLFF